MSATYAIIFRMEIGTEKGGWGTDVFQSAELPFLPRKGDMIALTKLDDCHEVEDVYWTAGLGFEVFFKFEDRTKASLKLLKNAGWTEEK